MQTETPNMPSMSKRTFMTIPVSLLCSELTSGCSATSPAYDQSLAEMTQPLSDSPAATDLVRYATLAANNHNAQPWRFRVEGQSITVLPDPRRSTPVVDPDNHHMFASLGCAAENLSIAARARGMSGVVATNSAERSISVEMRPGTRENSVLFDAIPLRQCSRASYDGKSISSEVLARLEQTARLEGVEPMVISGRKAIENILALLIEGNNSQLSDPSFVAELKAWMRFNRAAAGSSRDGLLTSSSGSPELPSWLGPVLFNMFLSKGSESDKLASQVRSSSCLVVLVASSNDISGWIAAGRAYQRLALQATVDGLKHAFVNQAVEVISVRRELQSLLGIGERRPDLVLRLGYGPSMPRSLRRKVTDVMA
jgi:hypothetical protein